MVSNASEGGGPSRAALLNALEEVDYNSFRRTFQSCDLEGKTLARALFDTSDQQESETKSELSDEQDEPPPRVLSRSDYEESTSEKEGLTWRLDSTVSHSDWSIRIVGKTTTTYHVHKTALSVGARKSCLFQRLFRQPTTGTQTTFRDFSELEMEALPIVLDYIYSGNLGVTTHTATAVHALSQRFEIQRLRNTSRSFWIKDLHAKTAPVYFDHARALRDVQILKAVALCCTKNVEVLLDLDKDIDFVLSVVEMPKIVPSLELSLVVAVFCKQNRSELAPSSFYRLAAALKDQIDPKAATALLQTQLSFLSHDTNTAQQKSLTLRCIQVLSDHWLNKKDQREVLALLPHSSFRECFLEHSLAKARKEYKSSRQQHDATLEAETCAKNQLEQRNEDLKRKYTHAIERNKQLEAELDDMKKLQAAQQQREHEPRTHDPRGSILSAIITQLNKCASATK